MWIIKKENKFVSYLIILISLFILFIVALNQYKKIQVNLDNNQSLKLEKEKKSEQVTKNNNIRAKIKNDENITNKYLISIKEDELIDYIYSYVEKNTIDSVIEIKGISISESKKNELWFLETDISLSVKVSDEKTMKRLLNFFISEDSKYKFFIDTFTYPNDWRTLSYTLDIPLKIFYK